MKLFIASLVLFLSMAGSAFAQSNATSTSKLGWDQAGVASTVEAQGLTYKYYLDGSATGTTITGVTCTGVSPSVSCQATFPVTPAGSHTLTMTASNVAGESLKSTALPFVYVVVPSAPSNLRIQ